MQVARERTVYLERYGFGGLERKFVTHAREHREAFEVVISIIPPRSDVQEQIDLRRREDADFQWTLASG